MLNRKTLSVIRPAENASAAPRSRIGGADEYRVIRSWPGVHDGQIITLRSDRGKRLLKSGFVEAL